MKTLTKFITSTVAAVALAAVAVPSQAAVFMGLQQTGVNGGAITDVSTIGGSDGGTLASFIGSYGTFEVNAYSAVQGILPVLESSSGHTQTVGTGGVLDIYVTRTGITGPIPTSFTSSFTNNILASGWSVTATTYVNAANGLWGGTQLATNTFNSIGTFVGTNGGPAGAGPYSATLRYTITAPTSGEAEASIALAAVPEPATWGLMIMGFGGIGALVRNRRRQFAFAINKKEFGYYVVFNLTAQGGALDELERSFRIADDVVRHKLIRLPEDEAARRGLVETAA